MSETSSMPFAKRFAAALWLSVAQAVAAAPPDMPNVVMIMADDWGWSDIAAYRRHQGLADPIATPNLDRLCAEGMMFTDAHSPAALCAPTRFSMMTGSNPYRNTVQWGTWGFTAASAFSKNREHVTVGEVAQAAGYRTAFFGKMHFGGGIEDFDQKMPVFPTSYGFDYVFSTHGGIQDPPYLYFENDRFVKIDPADPLNPSAPGGNADVVTWAAGWYPATNGLNNIQSSHAGIGDPGWQSSQNGIINSRKAAGFIRDHVANHPGRPFMLYYCAPQVHVPHTPPVDFEPDAAGHPGTPPNVPVAGSTGGDSLADMVHELDLQVGWIVARLEDPDGDGDPSDSILANTLVMFTSDNGGLASERGLPGYDSTGPLRGAKAMMVEGGHRVPFVARWGDGTPEGSRIAPGSVSGQLICGHDWVGAMYALTGQSMAENQAMDCANILPILLGEQDESVPVHDFMLHQSQNTQPYPYAIRQGDHVLFIDLSRQVAGELYNLSNDLAQATNLLAGTPLPEDVARSNAMHTLFLRHDQANDLRTTVAYTVPDAYPPLPNPAGFAKPPAATGCAGVAMTATEGSDPSGPVEYFFDETTGRSGGASSGWQLSPAYANNGLLPHYTYAYTVTLRDAEGNAGHPSPPVAVTLPGESFVFLDDFAVSADAGNVAAAPYPTAIWHLQDARGKATHWTRDDQADGGSVQIGDFTSDGERELRLGWGYDEVVVLYSTAAAIETNRTYTFSGTWEISSLLEQHLGFIAGLAEFSAADGALVRRLTPDTHVFGNTVAPSVGETGTFSVAITPAGLAAAGAAPGNRIGVFFHHDDDGTPYSDNAAFAPHRNDVYLIGQAGLAMDIVDPFERWAADRGVEGYFLDPDRDGLDNRYEFGLGGEPLDPASTGYLPALGNTPDGLRYVYPRRREAGLDYRLETRTNLVSGGWTTGGYAELPETGRIDDEFEAVTNDIPSSASQGFIRLIIE